MAKIPCRVFERPKKAREGKPFFRWHYYWIRLITQWRYNSDTGREKGGRWQSGSF
jgi:hypothetical protein